MIPEIKRPDPLYPGCLHPNVDLTRKKCVYCGKPLSEDEIKDRAFTEHTAGQGPQRTPTRRRPRGAD